MRYTKPRFCPRCGNKLFAGHCSVCGFNSNYYQFK